MNKDIHCLKKWDEVIIFNNEIFYTPPNRFLKPVRFRHLTIIILSQHLRN